MISAVREVVPQDEGTEYIELSVNPFEFEYTDSNEYDESENVFWFEVWHGHESR